MELNRGWPVVLGVIFSTTGCGGSGSDSENPAAAPVATAPTAGSVTNDENQNPAVMPESIAPVDPASLEVWVFGNGPVPDIPMLLIPGGWATPFAPVYFEEGAQQAVQNYPALFVQWRSNNESVEFHIEETILPAQSLVKTFPAEPGDILNGCWERIAAFGNLLGIGGIQTSSRCFSANGSFTSSEGIGNNLAFGSDGKSGTYRLNGHEIQLTFPNGEQESTMFGWRPASDGNGIEIVVDDWYSAALL